MDNFSLILPHLRKKYMEEFAEKCKQLWGWAGKEAVQFTELWQREDEAAEEAAEPEEETISENSEAEEGGSNGEALLLTEPWHDAIRKNKKSSHARAPRIPFSPAQAQSHAAASSRKEEEKRVKGKHVFMCMCRLQTREVSAKDGTVH
jgi:hypothetical protein